MCMYSTLPHDKLKYTHMAHGNFRFELNFQISKLDLGFQINSNGFSRDRSFQHNSILWHLQILKRKIPSQNCRNFQC